MTFGLFFCPSSPSYPSNLSRCASLLLRGLLRTAYLLSGSPMTMYIRKSRGVSSDKACLRSTRSTRWSARNVPVFGVVTERRLP